MFDNKKLTKEQKEKLSTIFFDFIYSGTITEKEFKEAFKGEKKEEYLKQLLTKG